MQREHLSKKHTEIVLRVFLLGLRFIHEDDVYEGKLMGNTVYVYPCFPINKKGLTLEYIGELHVLFRGQAVVFLVP